jgi:hypothetical protein
MAGQYDISGPGLVRALQEAASARKNLVIVYDYDNLGRVLRLGYFFKDRRIKDFQQQEIIWFEPGEVSVIPRYSREPRFRQARFTRARLDIGFHHPRRNERHFLLNLPSDSESRVILRNLFRIHRNLVTGFVIQVEVRTVENGKDQWRPVIRYDCAHGFIHRDAIAADGQKTKHKLAIQDTRSAIALAIDELRDNLNSWLRQLGYEQFDRDVLVKPDVIEEMNKAKSTLLDLVEHPEKMNAMQSRFVQLKDGLNHQEKIWPP